MVGVPGTLGSCLLTQDDPEVMHKAAEAPADMLKDLADLTDLQACIDNPTAALCIAAALALTPQGKIQKGR
ncbi:hypothetical protein D1794_29555 (plasmid) [Streptomyces clavuligerus]|nr:hypothetical protein D1794_29555 [Streptomyces clavuligerus]